MEPLEEEFFAEKEEITIIPNFSENKICLISVSELPCDMMVMLSYVLTTQGDFGPFNPSMHTKVPLWLAVNLKQRHKCRIEPPSWLCVGEESCKPHLLSVGVWFASYGGMVVHSRRTY